MNSEFMLILAQKKVPRHLKKIAEPAKLYSTGKLYQEESSSSEDEEVEEDESAIET